MKERCQLCGKYWFVSVKASPEKLDNYICPRCSRNLKNRRDKLLKHGKRPTMKQKKLISSRRLNPMNWLVVKDTPDFMEILHRHSNKRRNIDKGRDKPK